MSIEEILSDEAYLERQYAVNAISNIIYRKVNDASVYVDADKASDLNDELSYLELENLFDAKYLDHLKSSLLKVTNDKPKKTNTITNSTSRITSYISDKIENRYHEIKYSTFFDYLISIGCDADDINESFEFLDVSYDDYLNLKELMSYLESVQISTKRFSIELYLKKLRLCPLLPGFVDAFSDNSTTNEYELLPQKLFKYLLNHRLPSDLLNIQSIEDQLNNLHLRRKFAIAQEVKYQNSTPQPSKTVLKNVQCIRSLKVCCSHHTAYRLFSEQPNKYWETPKYTDCDSHAIVLYLKENIRPQQLFIAVNSRDDILRIFTFEVYVVNEEDGAAHLISTCSLQSATDSEYLLCDSFPDKIKFTALKISIKTSRDNSSPLRVKSLKLIGIKHENPSKEPSVHEASIGWFFDILSTMSLMQLHLMPTMYQHLLNVSKSALANMPPLSLAPFTHNKILSEAVLTKAESFLKNLIEIPQHSKHDQSQAVLLYLNFNLARGHLKNTLWCLNWILSNMSLTYDFRDLIPKLDKVSEDCLRKTADQLKLSVTYHDAIRNDKNCTKASFLLESNINQQIFMSEPGVKRFNLLIKSDKLVTLTNLFMKNQRGPTGVKDFLLFFITSETQPHISDFDEFNYFTETNYQEFKQREADAKRDYKVAFFSFLDKQTETHFELPLVHQVKYILVKFLRAKESTAESIGLCQLKFSGCTYENIDIYNQFSVFKQTSPNPVVNSGAIITCAILWFLCQMAEKHKSIFKLKNDSPKLLNFGNFEIADLWQLYETLGNTKTAPSKETQTRNFFIKIPILCLLYEIVNCDEVKQLDTSKSASHFGILSSLRELIDCEHQSVEIDNLKVISRHILLAGIDLFFGSAESRRRCFIEMLNWKCETISLEEHHLDLSPQKRSSKLLFEAFCSLFCKKKDNSNTLLNLEIDENFLESNFEAKIDESLNFIEKLIELNMRRENCDKNQTVLNRLLNKMQSYICYKVYKFTSFLTKNTEFAIDSDTDSDLKWIKTDPHRIKLAKVTLYLLSGYTKLLSRYLRQLVETTASDFKRISTETLITQTLRSFILWLLEYAPMLDSALCLELIAQLDSIGLNSIAIPTEEEPQITKEETVCLKQWSIDTKSFSSLSNIRVEFNCVGAKYYVLEFDPACDISTNIITVHFIDSDGREHSCAACIAPEKDSSSSSCHLNMTGALNEVPIATEASNSDADEPTSDASPSKKRKEMRIDSKDYLRFSLTSSKDFIMPDDRAYMKFKCRAYGLRKVAVDPVSELRSMLAALFGLYFGRIYSHRFKFAKEVLAEFGPVSIQAAADKLNTDATKVTIEPSTKLLFNNTGLDETAAFVDLNSSLYKTVLRSGVATDLAEESLQLNRFLTGLISVNEPEFDISDDERAFMRKFLEFYEAQHQKVTKKPKIMNSERINRTVVAIFASLVWHCPSIRYEHVRETKLDLLSELEGRETDEVELKLNEHILQAYKAAESTRMLIIEQQQLSKMNTLQENNDTGASPTEDFIDKIALKANFLLKLERMARVATKFELDDDYDYDSAANKNAHGTTAGSKSSKPKSSHTKPAGNKLTSRLPKFDAYPSFGLIFDFMLDAKVTGKVLEKMRSVLEFKKSNGEALSRALTLSKSFLKKHLYDDNNPVYTQRSLNFALTFLSCFFELKTKYYGKHFLHNLLGCGAELESSIRAGFYELVEFLFEYTTAIPTLTTDTQKTRLSCYLLHLLDVDWQMDDWHFVHRLNLPKFYLRTSCDNITLFKHAPMDPHTHQTPTEILEKMFNVCQNHPNHPQPIDDSDTFDLKIYPKMYKNLFQSTTGRRFDTDSLITCLSREPQNDEQREKFSVSRYMIWKYFYKLKVNFCCDVCETLLIGNRYMCIDCREYSLCFTCFSKSMIGFEAHYKSKSDESRYSARTKPSPAGGTHRPEHRILLLDHCCDSCGALIIGKRVHCEQCDDYDLCLMCSRLSTPETASTTHSTHTKEHKMTTVEPSIFSAKSNTANEHNIYLYLHSMYLFNHVALKLSQLVSKCDKPPKNHLETQQSTLSTPQSPLVPFNAFLSHQISTESTHSLYTPIESVFSTHINHLHSECIRLVIRTLEFIYSPKTSIQHRQREMHRNEAPEFDLDKLHIYATYTQEVLMGLLASIVHKNTRFFIKQSTSTPFSAETCLANLNNSSKFFSIYELIAYFLRILVNKNDNLCEEIVGYMITNALIKLLENAEPHKVDQLVHRLNKTTDETLGTGECTLNMICEWVNQGVQYTQTDVVYGYIKLICKLSLTPRWRSSVFTVIDKLLNSLLRTGETDDEMRSLNFLCALICTPVNVYVGQWIEYKQEKNFNDSERALDQHFKNGLLKQQTYDDASSDFNMMVVDSNSRNTVNLKNLKYDLNFKKSSSLTFDHLPLNVNNCLKLIRIFKKLIVDSAIEETGETRVINLAKITLKDNVVLLCISTLLKEFQAKYASRMQAGEGIAHDDCGTMEVFDENEIGELFVDEEFIRLVAEISHLGTNMNANWLLQHLQTYFFRLLMKEGISSLYEEAPESGDEVNLTEDLNLGEVKTKEKDTKPKKSEGVKAEAIDKGIRSIEGDANGDDQAVMSTLRATLERFAVVGIDDTGSFYEMDDTEVRSNKKYLERRLRRSYMLLKNATERIAYKMDEPEALPLANMSNSNTASNINKEAANVSSASLALSPTSQTKKGALAKSAPASAPVSIRSTIKKVNMALLVLCCRELLIFLVNNWPKNSEPITSRHLNCKTEAEIFDLMYLLYNSIDSDKFKLISRNIVSLLDVNALSKISIIASNHLLPNFRHIKSVEWKSSEAKSKLSGRLNRKSGKKPKKGKGGKKDEDATDGDDEDNLDDVEALAGGNEYNLVVVFDLDKTKIGSNKQVSSKKKPNGNKLSKASFKGFSCNAIDRVDVSELYAKLAALNESLPKQRMLFDEDFGCASEEDEEDLAARDNEAGDGTKEAAKGSDESSSDSDAKEGKKKSGEDSTRIFFDFGQHGSAKSGDEADDDDYDDTNERDAKGFHYWDDSSEYSDSSSSSRTRSVSEDDDDDDDDGNERYSESERSREESHDYSYNDYEATRAKRNLKIEIDVNYLDNCIAIKGKSLKWKIVKSKSSEEEACCFHIYSCMSHTFDSSFMVLSEIFNQQAIRELPLNELWTNLVRTACIMTASKRLKIIHLMLRIIEHVHENDYEANYINLFALKPLRSLLKSLAIYEEGDTSSLRALYELFFNAEKLVAKWAIQNEYVAKLKSEEDIVARVVDVLIKIKCIDQAICVNTQEEVKIEEVVETVVAEEEAKKVEERKIEVGEDEKNETKEEDGGKEKENDGDDVKNDDKDDDSSESDSE